MIINLVIIDLLNKDIFKMDDHKLKENLKLLRKNNIRIFIIIDKISNKKNITKIFNELHVLKKCIEEEKIKYENIAYFSDNFNNISKINKVGFCGCSSNSINELKQICNYIGTDDEECFCLHL